MRYMGGKHRISKDLAATIRALRPDGYDTYLEPFVGGASVLTRLAPEFSTVYAGDAVEDLVLMWEAAASGWIPPAEMSEGRWRELRYSSPSPERAFAGFGCSFGGMWFGSYARGDTEQDYAGNAHRGVLRKAANMGGVTFRHCSFDRWEPGDGWVVYCDPPYTGTAGYSAAGRWDPGHFWATAARWSEAGALVLVSEYQAPDGWSAVWEKAARVSLAGEGAWRSSVEKLFAYGPTVEIA